MSLHARTVASFAQAYPLAFLITATLLGLFEAMFDWGIGLLGAAIPVLIASNRAAETYAATPDRRPDAAEAWWLAGEMGALAMAISTMIILLFALPLIILSGAGEILEQASAALGPGALLASALAGAGLAVLVVRVALPMQVDAARRR
ncbi:MAG: ABZJ_00895 family protein [Pseudomonadota bacterium]